MLRGPYLFLFATAWSHLNDPSTGADFHRRLTDDDSSAGYADFSDPYDYAYLFAAVFCVISAGLASGLTMSLISLDKVKLEIKLRTGTQEEKDAVLAVMPVLHNHHFLLCTLLVFNAAASESLPVLLALLMPDWVAVVLSVILVLVFGEILPSALFTGKDQLIIASNFVWLVIILEITFGAVAFPMGMLLDCMFGAEEEEMLSREELSALLIIMRSNPSEREEYKKVLLSEQEVRREQERKLKKTWLERLAMVAGRGGGGGGGGGGGDGGAGGGGGGRGGVGLSKEGSSGDMPSETTEKSPLLAPSSSKGGSSSRRSSKSGDSSTSAELTVDEVEIMHGVLSMTSKLVRDICIPLERVKMLQEEEVYSQEIRRKLEEIGHSRLPVYRASSRTNIVGFLLVKKLVAIDSSAEHEKGGGGGGGGGAKASKKTISDLPLTQPMIVSSSATVLETFKRFQVEGTHLALVTDDEHALKAHQALNSNSPPSASCAPFGIVTLEDVLECILQAKIEDETDRKHTTETERIVKLQSALRGDTPLSEAAPELSEGVSSKSSAGGLSPRGGPGSVMGRGRKNSF